MRVSKDINQCKILWEKYSPNQTLWDDWDVVFAFFHEDSYEPYFMEFEFGLLPLWFDKKISKYYFFGGTYPEGRTFWFDIKHFKEAYEQMPTPLKLIDMDGNHMDEILKDNPQIKDKLTDDYSYYLNLEDIDWKIENYLGKFSKKHRYNLLYDIKKAESRGITKTWSDLKHFEYMVKFNVARFEGESDFSDPVFTAEIKLLFETINSRGELISLIIKKDEEIVGVEYAAFNKGIYYILNGGYSKDYPNIGKVLILEHIKKAIELKAKGVDLLTGDTGWKQMWNLEKIKKTTLIK